MIYKAEDTFQQSTSHLLINTVKLYKLIRDKKYDLI